jgi:hypothetical protein
MILMARNEAEVERLVEAWCSWYDKQDPEDEWAAQELIDDLTLGEAPVEECWVITLKLAERAPNNKVLGIIGASPIEDLLARDPERVAQLIKNEAAFNERLRKALGHVWRMPSVPEAVYQEVMALALPMDTGETTT